jgi:hypothetical protein
MKEMGMLRMLTDRPVFRYIPPVWMLSLLALMALRLPVSAAEFFAFLAMTGIVLGPYLLYEAQHVVVRALGWIVTLLSVIGIGYFTWGFVYGELTIPKVRPTWILLGITVVLPFVLAIGREFQRTWPQRPPPQNCPSLLMNTPKSAYRECARHVPQENKMKKNGGSGLNI